MPLVWVLPAQAVLSVGLVRRMLSGSVASTRRARLDDRHLATSGW